MATHKGTTVYFSSYLCHLVFPRLSEVHPLGIRDGLKSSLGEVIVDEDGCPHGGHHTRQVVEHEEQRQVVGHRLGYGRHVLVLGEQSHVTVLLRLDCTLRVQVDNLMKVKVEASCKCLCPLD